MDNNELTTKTINEINVADNRFFIPDYQRGYRWKEPEIHALLNDILAHLDRRPAAERNYCLQPVVAAARDDGSWEVIDGQQRLTTIYIILRYLNPAETAFSIRLSTRKDSQEFLSNLSSADPDVEEDIDSFHIAEAWRTTANWFEEQSRGRNSLKQKFFIGLSEQVEVIWYEVRDGSNHMDIFTRLNIGKIPLTNAELTKALLITSIGTGGSPGAQVRMEASRDKLAMQWDAIESALRDNRLWLYLNSTEKDESNRIDLLFRFHYQVYAKKSAAPRELDVFHYFEEYVGDGEGVSERAKNLWDEIRELFLRLSEWFDNREIYHLTGYLIATGHPLVDLYQVADGVPKSRFIQNLKDKITRAIQRDLKGRSIFDLNYYDDSKLISNILLLFNMITQQQSADPDQRFSFAQYKKYRWSLEHIHAQSAELLSTDRERRRWLEDHKEMLQTLQNNADVGADGEEITALMTLIEELLSGRIEDERFAEIQDRVFTLMSLENESEEIHSIENLALLDRDTNSHLKNAVFAVKRNRIIDRDRSGHFIPPTTRGVFLKYYSPTVDHTYYWSQSDREQYARAIENSLKSYFGHAIFGGNE
ncbi:MAG: DUF262 domain-containing protein [Alkalispirochaeta sp.]